MLSMWRTNVGIGRVGSVIVGYSFRNSSIVRQVGRILIKERALEYGDTDKFCGLSRKRGFSKKNLKKGEQRN